MDCDGLNQRYGTTVVDLGDSGLVVAKAGRVRRPEVR